MANELAGGYITLIPSAKGITAGIEKEMGGPLLLDGKTSGVQYSAAVKQAAALDTLFKASQVAGVSITQLAGEMQSAAPTAKILGLNIDQTAALVANLDKAGLPASRVMLGLATSFAKAAKAGRDPL